VTPVKGRGRGVWGEGMRLYVIYSTEQAENDQANVFEKTTVFTTVMIHNAMSAF